MINNLQPSQWINLENSEGEKFILDFSVVYNILQYSQRFSGGQLESNLIFSSLHNVEAIHRK